MASITVKFPESAKLPPELEHDPERARYLIVGALYYQREISIEEAQALTGDAPEVFAEKLVRYGFGAPGEVARGAADRGAGGPPPRTRWQALAERLERPPRLNLDLSRPY